MSAKGTPDVDGSVLSQETEKDAEHLDPDRELRRSNRTRWMNVRLDSDAVLKERIACLSKCKAGALSAVTAKKNAIEMLMAETNNLEQAKEQSSKLTDLFDKYMEAQQKLICTIDDKDAKTKAILEFDEAIKRTGDFVQRLKEWLLRNSANDQQDVQSSDSASQLTNVSSWLTDKTVKSHASSTRSSIPIARIEESARMAEWQVESKALKQRQIFHERERRLNEEKSKLAFELKELETELAKVRARESVFAEAELTVTKAEKTKDSVITTDSRYSCNKTPKAPEELKF